MSASLAQRLTPIKACVEQVARHWETRSVRPPITHAYESVCDAAGPLLPGEVTVVSSDDGGGRTSFALDLVRAVSLRQGRPCLFVSRESSLRVGARLLSAEGRVARPKAITGDLTNDERDRLAEAAAYISESSLFLLESPGATSASVFLILEAWLEHEPDLIVIDDAHELAVRAVDGKDSFSWIGNMARNLSVPVVLTARIDRPLPSNGDEAELPTDGELWPEAHSSNVDVSIVIHRPDLFDAHYSSRPGEADLHVRRRGADRHVVPLAFQGHYSRFGPMSKAAEPR